MRIRSTGSITQSIQPAPQGIPQAPNQHHPLLQSTTKPVLMSTREPPSNLKSTVMTQKTLQWSTKNPEQQSSSMKQSKMGTLIRNRLKSVIKIQDKSRQCQICDEQMNLNRDQKAFCITKCQHRNSYCQPCLLRYVIYRIKTSQEVTCPHQGCPAQIDPSTQFFKGLPIDVQRNFKTIEESVQKTKTRFLKVCPNQGCNGILRQSYQGMLTCNNCNNVFCVKCILPVHSGPCKNYDPKFFDCTQKYLQCKWCKAPVKKKQGSIHVVCKCGCQFCFVCGKNWTEEHLRGHNELGELGGKAVLKQNQQDQAVKQCTPGLFLSGLVKGLFMVVLFPVMLAIFFMRDIAAIVGLLLISIFAGLFAFSFEMITRVEGICCIMLVLFFPVTMIVGVMVAFKEIFLETAPEYFGKFWTDSLHCFCKK